MEPFEAEIKPFKGKQKDVLKCEICNYKCKKEKAMKKHVNAKHIEQKCRTCDKVFPSKMEVIMHTASEHSNNIKEDQKDIKPAPQAQDIEEDTITFDIATKYKCFECKEMFSI